MLWGIKRIMRKCIIIIRGTWITLVYRPKGMVKVLGKVYLDTKKIEFGKNVQLYPNVHIFGGGTIKIGNNVVIGDGTIICTAQSIVIGDDTMIAAQCYLTDCNHGMKLDAGPMRKQPVSVHKTRVGKNVWLGCGCKILAGSNIHDGAVVGAGTVVAGTVQDDIICYQERKYLQKLRR